jgi:hypothetical protein
MNAAITPTLKRIKLKNTSTTLQKIKAMNFLIDDRYYDKDNYPNIDWDMINEYYTSQDKNGIMDMSEVYTTVEKIQSDYDDLKTKQSNSTIDNEDLLTYELLGSFLTQYTFSYSLQKIKLKEEAQGWALGDVSGDNAYFSYSEGLTFTISDANGVLGSHAFLKTATIKATCSDGTALSPYQDSLSTGLGASSFVTPRSNHSTADVEIVNDTTVKITIKDPNYGWCDDSIEGSANVTISGQIIFY